MEKEDKLITCHNCNFKLISIDKIKQIDSLHIDEKSTCSYAINESYPKAFKKKQIISKMDYKKFKEAQLSSFKNYCDKFKDDDFINKVNMHKIFKFS